MTLKGLFALNSVFGSVCLAHLLDTTTARKLYNKQKCAIRGKKCSPGTPVPGDIMFVRLFAGFPGDGVSDRGLRCFSLGIHVYSLAA